MTCNSLSGGIFFFFVKSYPGSWRPFKKRNKIENDSLRIRNGYMDFVSLIKEQEKDQTFSMLAINFYTLPYLWRIGLHCKLVLLHYSVLQCFAM